MDNEPTTEDVLLQRLMNLLMDFRDAKPENRSELARRYSVTITELEKCAAYFASFCCGDLNTYYYIKE